MSEIQKPRQRRGPALPGPKSLELLSSQAKAKLQLHPVRVGDPITVAVEGGFIRRRATKRGVNVETEETFVFIPAHAMALALVELARKPENKAKQQRRQKQWLNGSWDLTEKKRPKTKRRGR